ncbi:MAG: hypothetical protein ACM4AI_00435 [Acidobacteriota bacterium]
MWRKDRAGQISLFDGDRRLHAWLPRVLEHHEGHSRVPRGVGHSRDLLAVAKSFGGHLHVRALIQDVFQAHVQRGLGGRDAGLLSPLQTPAVKERTVALPIDIAHLSAGPGSKSGKNHVRTVVRPSHDQPVT